MNRTPCGLLWLAMTVKDRNTFLLRTCCCYLAVPGIEPALSYSRSPLRLRREDKSIPRVATAFKEPGLVPLIVARLEEPYPCWNSLPINLFQEQTSKKGIPNGQWNALVLFEWLTYHMAVGAHWFHYTATWTLCIYKLSLEYLHFFWMEMHCFLSKAHRVTLTKRLGN